jgi:predicted nuclease with TOPRIM domain
MRDGKLQFRNNYMHGNPYFRLLRSEVEALVDEKYGAHYLKKKKLKTELAQIDKELRRLKAEAVSLEKRKAELLENISG